MHDTFCMRPSNDAFLGEKVGLQMLGVVDFDTSIMPDVFGLRAFDRSQPVVRVLPGDFSNTIWMLVPDVAATPLAFHDILIEDIMGTPEFRTKLLAFGRRRWPSSLFVDMYRRQAEMKTLCRGRIGTCPYCRSHILFSLSRHIADYHLELGQLWWCPVGWCTV